jgi:Golgi nucleoside diphosphatase
MEKTGYIKLNRVCFPWSSRLDVSSTFNLILSTGISTYANDPESVASHLQPLLSHARQHIPPSLEKETPLFLLATAGMRLLPPDKQGAVLHQACRFLSFHSAFKIDAPSSAGPCGSSVQIITGEEEGLFGWIAVNYLMNGFTGRNQNRTTYGFLDMGGASTQIAFEPGSTNGTDTKNLIDVRLRLLNGEEIKHKVFVTTWLGYGTNQARERYVGKAISEFEASRGSGDSDIVLDPCLPKDLQLTESPVLTQSSTAHPSQPHRLKGTGSFEQCMRQSASLLNKTAPCPDSPCLMNGIHVPRIDFSVSHFIGVSEYWYSSEHVFGLGGAYDFVQYERAASNFCSRDWAGIMKQHEASKAMHRLGGDGEVVENGKVVAAGKWDPTVERSRLEMQCFKAAWIANVLHEGIGMPRIVDPGGNVTAGTGKIEREAEKKGLGRPTFQSLDNVKGIAITWTLGKMVLEASKEVPLLSKTDRPLTDPIEDIPVDSPIQPIRPPILSLEGIEDRISPHLPLVLTRTSLGFSPVVFLFLVSLCLILLVAYPVRRQIRGLCLRSVLHAKKRDTGYSLEEGTPNGNGHSLPSSPTFTTKKWRYPLRRVLSFAHAPPHPVSLSVMTSNNPNLRRMNSTNPARSSPTRSYTLPNFDTSASSTQYSPRQSISRSPSPSPGFIDDTFTNNANNINNISSTVSLVNSLVSSRSRNASQMNLSSIVPRQISRTSSYQNSVNLQD